MLFAILTSIYGILVLVLLIVVLGRTLYNEKQKQKEECRKRYGADFYTLSPAEQRQRREEYELKQELLKQQQLEELAKRRHEQEEQRRRQEEEARRAEQERREAEEKARRAQLRARMEAEFQAALALEQERQERALQLQTRIDVENARQLQEQDRKRRVPPACYGNLCADCPREKRGLPCLLEDS